MAEFAAEWMVPNVQQTVQNLSGAVQLLHNNHGVTESQESRAHALRYYWTWFSGQPLGSLLLLDEVAE
jgi:hypothetical protein